MKIAIIDDEINEKYVKNVLIEKIYVINNMNITNNIENTHSTKILAILNKMAKVDFQVVNIIVFDEGKSTTIKSLQTALQICLDLDINIICMSLGTTRISEYDFMRNEIMQLYQKGVLLVAALNNDYHITLPACVKQVLGVRYDHLENTQFNRMIYSENDALNIECVVQYDFEKLDNYIIPSNSFALPILVGQIINKCKREDLKDKSKVLLKVCDIKQTYSEDYVELIQPLEQEVPVCLLKLEEDKDISLMQEYIKYINYKHGLEVGSICLESMNNSNDLLTFSLEKLENVEVIKNIISAINADIIFLVYKTPNLLRYLKKVIVVNINIVCYKKVIMIQGRNDNKNIILPKRTNGKELFCKEIIDAIKRI